MLALFSQAVTPLQRRRFSLLFVFLLATLVIFPYAERSHFSNYTLRILGALVILMSVYASGLRHGVLIFVLFLALPAIMQRMFTAADASGLAIATTLLSFVFDIFIIVMLFRHVFSKTEPTTETIFGALCIYLLIGFSFANVYSLFTKLHPNAFYMDPTLNAHTVPDRFDFVYYSFGTMTSVGANGIVAVLPQVRSFTLLESILGVLYLAVLIARLMGTYRSVQAKSANGE